MYKCFDCGETFEEPKEYCETVPYGCQDVVEKKHLGCPSCGGDFDESKECEYCGKHFLEEESRSDVICNDCIDEVDSRFKNLLHNNFTKFEVDLLNDIYDGKCFGD